MVTRRLKDMPYLSLTPEEAAGMGPEKPMRLSIRRVARCIVGRLAREPPRPAFPQPPQQHREEERWFPMSRYAVQPRILRAGHEDLEESGVTCGAAQSVWSPAKAPDPCLMGSAEYWNRDGSAVTTDRRYIFLKGE